MSYVHSNMNSQSNRFMNNQNPRSRTNRSGAANETVLDRNIIENKRRIPNINISDDIKTNVLNDSNIPRELMSMNYFREYFVFKDFSHINSDPFSMNGIFIYENDFSLTSDLSAVSRMIAGKLKLPIYLQDEGYDMSEIFIEFKNIKYEFLNLTGNYHFKFYPDKVSSIPNPIKYQYKADFDIFTFATPQRLDELRMEIRDKTGNIVIPHPIQKGILLTGNPTIINSPNHGLQNGFYIYIKTRLTSASSSLNRNYTITIIDNNNFSFNYDSTNFAFLNNSNIEYIIDNYNFEFNIRFINIKWDNNEIISSRK